MYLREIGNIPLLTPEAEQALAKRIVLGDEAAKDTFISANLRLMVSVAKKYSDSTDKVFRLKYQEICGEKIWFQQELPTATEYQRAIQNFKGA